MDAARNAAAAENISDLSHARHGDARRRKPVEQRFAGRFERIVASVGRAGKFPSRMYEGARDDPADSSVTRHNAARRFTDRVQPFQRNDGRVCRDLQDGIRRCIEDRSARAQMLWAEPLNDLRAGSDLIAQKAYTCRPFEIRHYVRRKSRINAVWALQHEAGKFIMPRRRILGGRLFPQARICRARRWYGQ